MTYQIIISKEEVGEVIHLISLGQKTSATIFTMGGLLNAFTIKEEDAILNCIDGFSNTVDAQQTITDGFKSTKLSPFVCRMQQGSYVWRENKLQTDKFFLGKHTIHGLIYDLPYKIEASGATSENAFVVLAAKHLHSNGYPFTYVIKIAYTLKGNTLTIVTTITNESTEIIPIADGWHPYFTLGTTIDNCTLTLNTNTQLVFDEELIPTGATIPDTRFEKPRLLSNIFLDNCFALNATNTAAILANKEYRLTINAEENYPYVQVYTPPHRNSIAIENLSAAPDCFNNKIGLKQLAPKESIHFSASYSLEIL